MPEARAWLSCYTDRPVVWFSLYISCDGVQLGAPGMKPSVRVGEAALREVAAYLLDYRGFAGIPPACLVLCRHSKLNYTVSVPRIESIADLAVLPGRGDAGGLPQRRSGELDNPTHGAHACTLTCYTCLPRQHAPMGRKRQAETWFALAGTNAS